MSFDSLTSSPTLNMKKKGFSSVSTLHANKNVSSILRCKIIKYLYEINISSTLRKSEIERKFVNARKIDSKKRKISKRSFIEFLKSFLRSEENYHESRNAGKFIKDLH